MRLPIAGSIAVLLSLGVWSSAYAAEGDGEVHLWIRATYTGVHTSQSNSHSAAPAATTTASSVQDRLTVVCQGTSIWRLKEWAATPATRGWEETGQGGGQWRSTTRGLGDAWVRPFVHTQCGNWTYTMPAKYFAPGPLFSPGGAVSIQPGVWFLSLFPGSGSSAIRQKGGWFNRVVGSHGTTQEDHPIDADNEAPGGCRARQLVFDAYNGTFGPDGAYKSIKGTWDTDKKGFFVSGHITTKGGKPNTTLGQPPTGKPEDGDYSTESTTWTADILWTLSYAMTPAPVECIIEPGPGYEKWEPKGGPDEKTMGNKLAVRAYLQVKDHPDQVPLQRVKKFHFELVGASQEPGVALNVPLEGAGTEPDLKIEQSPTIEPKEEGRVGESIGGGLTYANAIVGCYDYGAYGSLRVTAELTDGSVIYGHLKGQPGKEELAIPLDDNHNHIADAWEQRKGIFGKNLPAEWDGQTEPALDGTAGDGISLYEKYRGLVHKGAPVEWDLNVKNLVVVNEIGDSVQPGLKLFQSASGVHVVELSKGELPDSRVVNRNASTGVESLQHALRLTSKPLGAGIVGLAMPANMIKQSPLDCTEMAINSDLSFIPGAARAQFFAVGIAHEFGHALGAQHHGDSDVTATDLVITQPGIKIYDADGKEITDRPYTLKGVTECKATGGESSGEEDCVMRNSSFFQWVLHESNAGKAYYCVPPTAPGTTFCKTQAGSGINAKDNAPISYFGDATTAGRGACSTHMRIRD